MRRHRTSLAQYRNRNLELIGNGGCSSETAAGRFTGCNLTVVGANLIDPLKFAGQLRQPRRCPIVVQGTSVPLVSAAVREPTAATGPRTT